MILRLTVDYPPPEPPAPPPPLDPPKPRPSDEECCP
jgi:hypothetical protein